MLSAIFQRISDPTKPVVQMGPNSDIFLVFCRGVYFYHAHTYFPLTTAGVASAESFKKTWHDEFEAGGDVLFGKTQDYLAGPHTRGNFETAFTRDSYGDVLMWLQQHRPRDLSILIHPLTVCAVSFLIAHPFVSCCYVSQVTPLCASSVLLPGIMSA